jgi:hypothetical protein
MPVVLVSDPSIKGSGKNSDEVHRHASTVDHHEGFETMYEYFSYGVCHGYSFQSVTLLGERSDRADMLWRVAWFGTAIDYEETAAWAVRLVKVLGYR